MSRLFFLNWLQIPSQMRLQNTKTATLHRDKTSPASILRMILNNLMLRLLQCFGECRVLYHSHIHEYAKWTYNVQEMYSYGPPHMAVQKQDDQHEHTFSSYVRIQDVVLKTCRRRWTIGRSGERGSGISVLPARHDDDDDDDDIGISKHEKHLTAS